ncbi:MAG: 16S rRNA (cytosine(1402)-N(4))-methyltransferase, partial [Clostridia bacterium]|nr:16S rRNA (cytosine(1402)-N(4))-methyltransferase [Clostridia bacterium]
MKSFSHVPVMLEQCMQGLNIKYGGTYFDGTVGGGGHSFEILKRSAPTGKLIATD